MPDDPRWIRVTMRGVALVGALIQVGVLLLVTVACMALKQSPQTPPHHPMVLRFAENNGSYEATTNPNLMRFSVKRSDGTLVATVNAAGPAMSVLFHTSRSHTWFIAGGSNYILIVDLKSLRHQTIDVKGQVDDLWMEGYDLGAHIMPYVGDEEEDGRDARFDRSYFK